LDFLKKKTNYAGLKSGIFGRCVELCVSVQGAGQLKFDILGREILVGLKLISLSTNNKINRHSTPSPIKLQMSSCIYITQMAMIQMSYRF